MKLVIHTDGGGQSGENVGGEAGAAYTCQVEDGTYIGSRSMKLLGTNNDAEYMGVLLALKDLQMGVMAPLEEIEAVRFVGDSQVIVYQLTGAYKCKHVHLRRHRDDALKIVAELPFPVRFTWERREHNKNADCLVAAAMVHGPKTSFHLPIPPDPR